MNNVELYINNQLTDIRADLGVRLNRQLINPGELNTKDAQYSYSISLPATANNHKIFNYTHVEETKNKFNRDYEAQLIINSVKIFAGKFRLSAIDKNGYKGNLYVAALRTIRDIFGELKLNENPEYRIPFSDFAASINAYNASAADGPQMAIFPYVLYGVLPKTPLNKNANSFSPRNVWDASVKIGMQDLPPSINPLLMLRHIFNSQGYGLQGTAFDDVKLMSLYQSYKNADNYVQPWNYGQQAKIKLSGAWGTRYEKRTGAERLERGVNQGSDPTGNVFACDFLDATNTRLDIIEDTGGNVLYKEINDADLVTWINGQIRIPTSGFYKVEFGASLRVFDWDAWRITDSATGVQHIGGVTQNANNNFFNNHYEIRLCRDRGAAAFGLNSPKLNNTYYYNNQPQNRVFDGDNIPKYFPPVTSDGGINFVDLSQDRNHLLGFSFGMNNDPGYSTEASKDYINPLDPLTLSAVLPAKPSVSWMASENTTNPTRLAINAPGYTKYGLIGTFDNEGDNPNIDLDFSGGPFVTGQQLDSDGNPIPPSVGTDYIVLHRFAIERYFTYVITGGGSYTGNAYVHNGADTEPLLIVPFVGGVASFDTGFPDIINALDLKLTIYLKTPTFDVTGTLTIARDITPGSERVIGWEATNKYKIELDNAPAVFAKRGQFGDTTGLAPEWYAQGKSACVVWLEAGELITMGSVSSEGRYRQNGMHSTSGWVAHEIDFDLSIQPFRVDPEWLQVSLSGNGTGVMDWDDPVNFDTDSINLVGFLDAAIKTDDYIENFCKAFNLRLTQIDATTFSLDVKQAKKATTSQYIDLDGAASVKDRANTPLGLPSLYKLGFSINTDEEGFKMTGDDGGGQFSTGVPEGDIVEQKSFFSYNWFKAITKDGDTLALPIISKSDVWDAAMSYPEAMRKKYTDLAYRFWYYDGVLPGTYEFNGSPLDIAAVSNTLTGLSELSYKNAPLTILDNYFTLLINGASHYTEIDAYVSALQYVGLDGSLMVKFNNDLYFVAEITGYDPTGRNKTKLKLIRKNG